MSVQSEVEALIAAKTQPLADGIAVQADRNALLDAGLSVLDAEVIGIKARLAALEAGSVPGPEPEPDPDPETEPEPQDSILAVTLDPPTQTSVVVRIALSRPAPARTWYRPQGTTAWLAGPNETSSQYASHVQTVNGLVPGTAYEVRAEAFGTFADVLALSTPPAAQPDPPVVPDPPTGISYTDFPLAGVTSFGGFPIDPTGVVDSSRGINAWIQAQPNGTDATHHARYVFPADATYRLGSAAVCLGNKRHVTLWGHGAGSSAWRRGDPAAYPNPGCTLRPVHRSTPGAPYGSCFITGATNTGANQYSFNKPTEDVHGRGFDVVSTNPNPGIYASANEGDALVEMGSSTDVEFYYNRSRGMGGDVVRFRTARGCRVHHNHVLSTGRMGVTAVINVVGQARADNAFEHNTIDRCGYWGIDVEPEDHPTDSQRTYRGLLVRDNRWGSFATSGVGGGFAVIGGTASPGPSRVIEDVEISGNVLDGFSFGTWGTAEQRGMWTICQHLVTDPSRRVRNVVLRDNRQEGFAYSSPYAAVLTARYVDGLVVTGNDANYGGSPAAWMDDVGCTGVVESGNT